MSLSAVAACSAPVAADVENVVHVVVGTDAVVQLVADAAVELSVAAAQQHLKMVHRIRS